VREPVERAKILRFLEVLGRRLHRPVRFYLVGGSIFVDLGLRGTTVDLDYVVQSDEQDAIEEFERLVPRLKNELKINLKPASPADFLPLPDDVLAHSRYVRSFGNVHVYYFDLASTVISKVARGAERDLGDVEAMVRAGEVSWTEVQARWQQVRGSKRGWIRYDPVTIEARLEMMRRRLEGQE
jgi:hypothetical protein